MMEDGPKSVYVGGRLPFRYKLTRLVNHLREWILEDQANQGLGGPPNNWRGIHLMQDHSSKGGDTCYHKRYARFNNDAHEIWIGSDWHENGKTSSHWDTFMPAWVFRRFALWYLWRWAWGEWFGLRRWLFYKDLSRRVKKYSR